MDLQKIRALAGLPSVKQTFAKLTHDPVLEAGDAKFIVSSLRTKFAEFANVNVKVRDSIKEYLKANSTAPNLDALKEALALVSPKASFEQNNSIRKMAGLPPLVEKKDEDEEEENTSSDEVEELDDEDKEEVEDAEGDDKSSEEDAAEEDDADDAAETNDIAELVASIADKLLKDGAPDKEELTDFLMKVYQAGAADASK